MYEIKTHLNINFSSVSRESSTICISYSNTKPEYEPATSPFVHVEECWHIFTFETIYTIECLTYSVPVYPPSRRFTADDLFCPSSALLTPARSHHNLPTLNAETSITLSVDAAGFTYLYLWIPEIPWEIELRIVLLFLLQVLKGRTYGITEFIMHNFCCILS